MEDERPSGTETIDAVEIDYDRLDVAAIMDQVKRIAAAGTVNPSRDESPGTDTEPPPPPAAAGGPPPTGWKARIKAKALRAMVPFFPLIRLLVLPLHQELQAAVRELDRTNRRIDFLYGRLEDLDRSMEYVKLLHALEHNLVVEVTKLRIEFDGLKSRARILEKDLEAQTERERALEKRVLA